jgi:anion-transporting  ArsA/GET3 family ATPase
MVLGRIFYTCELQANRPYDLVIFDAPASGHMHNLMTTPDAIIRSGIGGPFVREVSRVKDFLSQAGKVGTLLVAVPEELVVSESLEFLPILEQDSPSEILGVVINRAVFDLDDTAVKDLEKYKTDPVAGRVSRYLIDKHEKATIQQRHLIDCMEKVAARKGPGTYGLLPELGVVPEPLPPQFGEKFLSRLEKP